MPVTLNLRIEPEGIGLELPRYQSEGAAGMDLMAAVDGEVTLGPGERKLISTGISISLPPGYEAQVRPRSGLALKHGITLLNSPGTIDADYRGVIGLIVVNHGHDPYTVTRGERLAQMVVAPVCRVEVTRVEGLPPSERGPGGFGHTG